MSLIVLIGAQAVGKMTVGKALEKQLDAKLLFNHQTIDLFANYLGYTERAFQLSDSVRKGLFRPLSKIQPQIQQKILFYSGDCF